MVLLVIMMTKEFSLSKIEEEAFNEWWKEHKHKCKDKPYERHITFSFTPTGIGSIIVAKCSCGKKIDITDVDCW